MLRQAGTYTLGYSIAHPFPLPSFRQSVLVPLRGAEELLFPASRHGHEGKNSEIFVDTQNIYPPAISVQSPALTRIHSLLCLQTPEIPIFSCS